MQQVEDYNERSTCYLVLLLLISEMARMPEIDQIHFPENFVVLPNLVRSLINIINAMLNIEHGPGRLRFYHRVARCLADALIPHLIELVLDDI